MLIVRTPFRVSLFGGSCDYPSYFGTHGSLVIGFAIDKYSYITCRPLPEIHRDYKYRLQYAKTETTNLVLDIEHNGVRGVLEYLNYDDTLDLVHFSDLPKQTGTGSSSSFAVGLLNAIQHMRGRRATKKQLARQAIAVERHILNEPGGWQDQIFAAYGGVVSVEFQQNRDFYVRPLPVCSEFLDVLQESLTLFYIGSRNSFDISQSYESKDCIEHKHAIAKTANEAYSAFKNEDLVEVGHLLDRSWRAKRQISALISNTFIDEAYGRALTAGAWGGKLLGSGGSGFLLVMGPQEKRKKIIESVGLPTIDFSFDFEGSRVIYDCPNENNN